MTRYQSEDGRLDNSNSPVEFQRSASSGWRVTEQYWACPKYIWQERLFFATHNGKEGELYHNHCQCMGRYPRTHYLLVESSLAEWRNGGKKIQDGSCCSFFQTAAPPSESAGRRRSRGPKAGPPSVPDTNADPFRPPAAARVEPSPLPSAPIRSPPPSLT